MPIAELLSQTSKLPNVPDVVRELIQHLSDPDVDYDQIAGKVAKDQTLSLKVLRLVNSAHFGLSRKVSSLDDALVIVGIERLKTLVIASGIAGSVARVEGLDLREFWSDSFRVAALARWFAAHGDRVAPDAAFTAGLIHNVGVLLLHLAAPDSARAVQAKMAESGCSRSEAERQVLDFTTPEAGQGLLDLWHFPAELGIAVRQHKEPASFEPPSPLAAVIHLARFVSDAIRDGTDIDTVKARFPAPVAELAGLEPVTDQSLDETLHIESELDGLLDS